MGKSNMNPWIIGVIIFAVAFFAVPSFHDSITDIFQSDSTSDAGGVCTAFDGTTMTIGPFSYKYSPGTSAATESANVYRVDGTNLIDLGSKNKTTTYETQPGDMFKIIYADSSSVFYGREADVTVPCAAAFETSTVDGGKYKLVANKTPTITVFNADDGLKNTETNNESLAANDAANMKMTVVYPSKGGWSPFGDTYISLLVNSTAITDVSLSSSDVTVTSADTPDFRQSDNSTTGFRFYTFKHSGIETENVKNVDYTITLESGSTDGMNNTFNIFFDDEDYYQDSDTGLPEFGVETEDDADVGHTTEVKQEVWLE